MKVTLGRQYKDRITGFVGIATGRCEYISGCNQALLVPSIDEKGGYRDGHWFDEQRLEVADNSILIELDNGANPGCDKAPPIR